MYLFVCVCVCVCVKIMWKNCTKAQQGRVCMGRMREGIYGHVQEYVNRTEERDQ